jgi:flagellar protein FliS
MNSTSAISTYNKVGLESGAMAADPHKLILMLYQGALIAITNAKNETLRKDVTAKGKSISHAIAIIGEGLHASLDKSIGVEMTRNLASLYDYMVMRLVAANLKNDIGILDEVTRLLTELEEAWESIRPNAAKPTTQHKPAANVQLVYARG